MVNGLVTRRAVNSVIGILERVPAMKFHLVSARTTAAIILTALFLAGCAATDPSDPLADSICNSKQGVKADPKRVAFFIRVVISTARFSDIATASSLYRRAQAMDETNPVPLIDLGNAMSGFGAHEQAAEAYRKALKLRPDHPDALHGL